MNIFDGTRELNLKWIFELAGSVCRAKTRTWGFRRKKLDVRPIESLLQAITLLLAALADLGRDFCPSSQRPSIHPSKSQFYKPTQKVTSTDSVGPYPQDYTASRRTERDRTNRFLLPSMRPAFLHSWQRCQEPPTYSSFVHDLSNTSQFHKSFSGSLSGSCDSTFLFNEPVGRLSKVWELDL